MNPAVRRNVVDNVMGADGAALSYEALFIASVCAIVDRRFVEADVFFDRIAARMHTGTRPDGEHFQLLLFNAHALKTSLYETGAIAAHQCGRLLRLIELVDPERASGQGGARPGRLPAIGRPHRFASAERPLADVDADIIIRKYYYGPGSRLHDIGWRTATGLQRGGWRTRVADLRHDIGPAPDALAAFVARPAGSRRRFAFVDLLAFFGPDEIAQGVAFLQRLRPHYDAVVCLVFDAWTPRLDEQIGAFLPHLDLIWSVHPFAAIFANPAVAAKTTFIPVMTGIDPEAAVPPADGAYDRPSFAGAIEPANIHRLYWYLLGRQYPEHLHFSVSALRDDGLDVAESQTRYLDRLRRARHCLNLCRRANGDRILTGRIFEVAAVNRLLVQEYCEDVRYYFKPGEHYVEFETPEELLAAVDDIRSRPEHFQRMAAEAHRFFREHYADAAVVRHLSHRLG